MNCTRAAIPDIILIEPDSQGGEHGFVLESYDTCTLTESGVPATFVEDQQLHVGRGALLGLHASRRHPIGKLVRVIEGEIFNVAVDIRRGSPTFGQWVSIWQSVDNARQCYIPAGFAHGFCVLSDVAKVKYSYTDFYDPTDEIHLLWNDPEIDIAWPVAYPKLSDQDRSALLLRELLRWFPAYECALEVEVA